ncbi:arylsulfatase [Aquisphaera insulae]|uniref:arylsulfatase n=1 Tax=Aquisphaera insulae TaxID=2712864 RepID=UPI00196A63E1|nr:arylsulfatase [Aquisphaera insulae]
MMRIRRRVRLGALATAILGLGAGSVAAQDEDFKGVIGKTLGESKPYYPPPVRPREGAPNVVYILLDDFGFSDLGSYGSEIRTPHIDGLAASGLRYNNYHSRAVCSPTRAALLTGRNAHSVGLNTVANSENGFPNGRGQVTRAAATVAELLRASGYNTYAFGKWHLVPPRNTSPIGPFENWPLQRGFDRYYGFLNGMTDQYHPELVRDNTRIDPPSKPGYHLTEDLVDQAIGTLKSHVASGPDKPFFLYLALGATHSPHQVPRPYIEKYVPVFEKGWDRTRADRLARQKQLGIVPSSTELAPPNTGIKPWDSLSADEKRLFVRLQAAYAGFVEHTDEQVGRLIEALRAHDRLENTIIVVSADNGASPGGGLDGTLNWVADMNGLRDHAAELVKRLDDIGTEHSFEDYPQGWAQAGNTPFPNYKGSIRGGGVNEPLIIHWPRGISQKGAVRSQFVDVIDITPTVLDLAGIQAPKVFNGVPQKPLEGASIAASFKDPSAPAARDTQYFEFGGQRALWHNGWKAVAVHRPNTSYDDDRWELFRLDEDFSETRDVAAAHPDILTKLKSLWWRDAERYGVLPLQDISWRGPERRAAKPQLQPGHPSQRKSYTFYPGQEHIPAEASPDILNRRFSVATEIDGGGKAVEGVILAQGATNGGYVLYVKEGKLVFDFNDLGRSHSVISSGEPLDLAAGKQSIRLEYVPSSVTEGTAVLTVNGKKVGEGKVRKSPTTRVLTWEGLDVGRDAYSPVSDAYAARGDFAFAPGALGKVQVELGERVEPASTVRATESQ